MHMPQTTLQEILWHNIMMFAVRFERMRKCVISVPRMAATGKNVYSSNLIIVLYLFFNYNINNNNYVKLDQKKVVAVLCKTMKLLVATAKFGLRAHRGVRFQPLNYIKYCNHYFNFFVYLMVGHMYSLLFNL